MLPAFSPPWWGRIKEGGRDSGIRDSKSAIHNQHSPHPILPPHKGGKEWRFMADYYLVPPLMCLSTTSAKAAMNLGSSFTVFA